MTVWVTTGVSKGPRFSMTAQTCGAHFAATTFKSIDVHRSITEFFLEVLTLVSCQYEYEVLYEWRFFNSRPIHRVFLKSGYAIGLD